MLAWALVGAGKTDQAVRKYDELLSADPVQADDLLNAAYCHWFGRDIQGAVALFRRYAQTEGVKFDPAHEFYDRERQLLSRHAISDVEVRLMTDTLSAVL